MSVQPSGWSDHMWRLRALSLSSSRQSISFVLSMRALSGPTCCSVTDIWSQVQKCVLSRLWVLLAAPSQTLQMLS